MSLLATHMVADKSLLATHMGADKSLLATHMGAEKSLLATHMGRQPIWLANKTRAQYRPPIDVSVWRSDTYCKLLKRGKHQIQLQGDQKQL